MTRPVERSEIVDYQTYEELRADIREAVMKEKEHRRFHVGPYLTFLFETHATMRYQIQEMMRVERMARESDIRHELETYNALLGDEGELGCCLLVEIDGKEERDRLLREWRELPEHVYMRFADGSRAQAQYDSAQVSDGKMSAVQYLKFKVGDRKPVAVGSSLPGLEVEALLTPEQQAALGADLVH